MGKDLDKSSESYRLILRSSAIIGGATVVNILVGLVRVKVAAVLLGPAGVGIIGLFQNLMAVAANLASLGFRSIGTRQIAEAVGKDDDISISAVRRALFWGTMVLALVGALVFWLLRDLLAARVLHEPARAREVGWLAIGVALSVATGSQTALLTGLRQIGNIARINVASSLLSTLFGVAALVLFGAKGVVAFVLVAPLTGFFFCHWYVRQLGPVRGPATPLAQLAAQWQVMARLGIAFMFSGLVFSLGELFVRSLLKRDLGSDAVGQFQAAWTVSVMYTGFVLSAMGADYYPRLSAAMNDKSNVNRLVNQQTEVALLLAGPMLLAILGLSPWVTALLYTKVFDETVSILRWQVLGDVLKVASWPLGYLILASGDAIGYFLSESAMMAVYVAFIWMALPSMGVQATGPGFLLMYTVYILLALWLCHRRTGLMWDRRVALLLAGLVMASTLVFLSAVWSRWLGAALGCGLAAVFGIYGVDRLGGLLDSESRSGALVKLVNWTRAKISVHVIN